MTSKEQVIAYKMLIYLRAKIDDDDVPDWVDEGIALLTASVVAAMAVYNQDDQ